MMAPPSASRAGATHRAMHQHRRTIHVLSHVLRPTPPPPPTATPPTSPVSPYPLSSSLPLALSTQPVSPSLSSSLSLSAPTHNHTVSTLTPGQRALSRLDIRTRSALRAALHSRLRLSRVAFPASLHALSDAQFIARLRLSPAVVHRLVPLLALPNRMWDRDGIPVSPLLATTVFLYIAAGGHPTDGETLFGRDAAVIKDVATQTLHLVLARHSHRAAGTVLIASRAQLYATAMLTMVEPNGVHFGKDMHHEDEKNHEDDDDDFHPHHGPRCIATLGAARIVGRVISAVVTPDGLVALCGGPHNPPSAGRLFARERGPALARVVSTQWRVCGEAMFVATGMTGVHACNTRSLHRDGRSAIEHVVECMIQLWPGTGNHEDGWVARMLLYNIARCAGEGASGLTSTTPWPCVTATLEELFGAATATHEGG